MSNFISGVESTFEEMTQNEMVSLNAEQADKDVTETSIEADIVSDYDMPALIDSNTAVVIPTEPEQLQKFAMVQQAAVNLGKSLLKRPDLDTEMYQNVLKQTQQSAEFLLDSELAISKILNGIPKAQGRRKNSDVETKADVVAKMGLTPKQARSISELDDECVERAKNMAREYNDVVCRNWAIRMKRKTETPNTSTDIEYSGNFAACVNPEYCAKYDASEPLFYTQLFANAGIGEYYLDELNVKSAVANELVANRAKWYQELYPDSYMIQGDFTDDDVFNQLVAKHHEKGCKMVLASPPCQPFSRAGKQDYNSQEAKLFLRTLNFIRAVDDTNQFVMIENVPQFLNACPDILADTEYKNIAEYIKGELESLGYTVNIAVLDASNYGTCQARERAIITAAKSGLWEFPCPDKNKIMLWECIGDLPSIEAGEDSGLKYHVAPSLPEAQIEVLKHTKPGKSAHDNPSEWKPKNIDGSPSNASFKSSFQRKRWDEPCNTITMASDSISGHRSVHPGRPLSDGTYSDARCFTILELLRVTGLPDDYPIPDWASDGLIRDVIGECFLPKLVKRLIEMLPV